MKRGLTAGFQVETIAALVVPTGHIVADGNGDRWQQMSVRVGRRAPELQWFRIEHSRADIAQALENEHWDADRRYLRPVSEAELAALMHRMNVPFHGPTDAPGGGDDK